MAFDADAYLEALEPPEIKLGGKVYKGRHLSLEEWMPMEKQFSDFSPESITVIQLKQLIRDFCNHAFPSPWWQLFNPRFKTVGEMVCNLPPSAMVKAATDFFESQARALDVQRAQTENEAVPFPSST